MPQKEGKGGHGSENYDPATGQYAKVLDSMGLDENDALQHDVKNSFVKTNGFDRVVNNVKIVKDNSISGLAEYDPKSKTIRTKFNNLDNPVAKFALAHEMGHAYDDSKNYFSAKDEKLSNLIREEADKNFFNILKVHFASNEQAIYGMFKKKYTDMILGKNLDSFSKTNLLSESNIKKKFDEFIKGKVENYKEGMGETLRNYAPLDDAVRSVFPDMFAYQDGHTEHDSKYWKNNPDNMNKEFFANATGALVANDKAKIELYEKYFPESFKRVKELLEEE